MRVFISYSSLDKKFVYLLSAALEDYSIKVFLYEQRFKIGTSLYQSLRKEIYKSHKVILVITSNSLKSPWVDYETQLTLIREKQGVKNILIPLLIHGGLIPSKLKDRYIADFSTDKSIRKNYLKFLNALGIPNRKIKPEPMFKHEVRAEYIGAFLANPATQMSGMDYFMSSTPEVVGNDTKPYVSVGQTVNPDTLLGRIGATFGSGEVEVIAGCYGIIEKILVQNLDRPSLGDVLFLIGIKKNKE
jgi:biotin carboxyl carrier protein